MSRMQWNAVLDAIAPGAVLAAIAPIQPWLEQRMVTHMIVELPLVFAIGAWAAKWGRAEGPSWLRQINVSGLSGLTMSMVISAFWMLPLSLDTAVLNPFVGWLKICSVLAAGWLTRTSLREARPAVQAFFVLNWAWMTGAAGALYQQAPERLCSAYLLGDQAWAGIGLVGLAIAAVVAWLVTSAGRLLWPTESSIVVGGGTSASLVPHRSDAELCQAFKASQFVCEENWRQGS